MKTIRPQYEGYGHVKTTTYPCITRFLTKERAAISPYNKFFLKQKQKYVIYFQTSTEHRNPMQAENNTSGKYSSRSGKKKAKPRSLKLEVHSPLGDW